MDLNRVYVSNNLGVLSASKTPVKGAQAFVNEELFFELIEEKAAKENLLEQSEQVLNQETRKVDLMSEEIDCLRSVLSEYSKGSGDAHNHFSQWIRAEEIRQERELWYDTETFGEVKS